MLLLLVSYKYVYNIIESFSENYNYIFNNIEIRGLKNIPPNQIEKYFVNYDSHLFVLIRF